MGSNESKSAVSTPKPEPHRRVRNERLSQLIDPRSPSTGINRTPIQVGAASPASVDVECDRTPTISDPRSPSPGVSRTPLKDVMKATVSSFTRRLGTLFLNDGVDIVKPPLAFPKIQNFNVYEDSEIDSSEPLLPACPFAGSSVQSVVPVGFSPPESDAASEEDAVCPAEQVEVEMGIEATQFLDEGSGVDHDMPLTVELSSSLLTYHDGMMFSQATVGDTLLSASPPLHTDGHQSSSPAMTESEPTDTPASPASNNAKLSLSSTVMDDAAGVLESKTELGLGFKPQAPNPAPPGQDQVLQTQTDCGPHRVRIPSFDIKSPSQAVFKPQWLGVGFGVAGRARGVQSKNKVASPLSQRNRQNVGNENGGQLSKQKQRERCGKGLVGEGRSPLQILKETNSPHDRASQMKLKSSTPDRARLGHMDRRVLSVSVNKENHR